MSAPLSEPELAAVSGYLTDAGVVLEGPLSATLIAGGRSNLTMRLEDGTTTWVLRMPPRAGRTPSAHDVAREYRVTAALVATGVPVPPTVALCEDESVIGSPFVVTAFVPGVTIQRQEELDALDDDAVEAVVDELTTTLAALHRVDHTAVGLADFGRPDGYAARQLRRWGGQWELVSSGALALDRAADEVISRLSAAVPDQRVTSILHGDFRIDNTLLRLDGAPRVAAVVDWELSTLGDPVADVAMMCAYRDPVLDLIVGAPSAWTSTRLPAVDELASRYEKAGGVSLVDWDFHLALAYFKIGVIAAGIAHRHRAGSGTGTGFESAGESVEGYLDLALAALHGR